MGESNKGFTLIEVIIVLAILAVLATGVLVNINKSKRAETTKIAEEIDSQLTKTRMKCMGKKDKYYLYVHKDSTENKYYIKESLDPADTLTDKGKVLGGSAFSIKYTEGSLEKVISEGHPFVLTFSKSTGSMEKAGGGIATCSAITVVGPAKTEVISLAPKTGKHGID